MSGFDGLLGAVLSQRYQLVRCIGEGGMGAVFEAVDRADGSKYAIKLLHAEYAGEIEIVERLYAEVQAASRLSHPNIARYYGFAQADNGSYYVVMELLEGVPLSRYVGAGMAYEVAQAVPILRGVLSALDAAHSNGIVHRDLKPDNIYLARTPTASQVPKLLDFGIAKIIDAAGGMMSKTKTGMLLGTPAYMSPEQIQNAKAVDGRTDLWSAGVILYQLLTGGEPFPAPSDMMMLTTILATEAVPIDHGRPHLAGWRDFFLRALAKDLDRRFPSAKEMARAMEIAADPRAAAAAGAVRGVAGPVPGAGGGRGSLPPTQGFDAPDPQPKANHPAVAVQVVGSGQAGMGRVSALYGPTPSGGTYPSSQQQPFNPAAGGAGGRYSVQGGVPANYPTPPPQPVNYPTPPPQPVNIGQQANVAQTANARGGMSATRRSELDRAAGPMTVPLWLAGLGVIIGIAIGFALGIMLTRG